MLVKIEIRCDNAAFEDNMVGEVQRILRAAGETFVNLAEENEETKCSLRDSNGNKVGFIEVDPERDGEDAVV
jgi:hypothetical protein